MDPRRNILREAALRTLLSFFSSLAIGLIRFGTVVFETSHWSFQLVIYGFVYGLFLAIWRTNHRNALAFLIMYFFAESAFLTGALAEARVLMVLLYFVLSAGALIWYERLFLRSARRSVARDAIGLAVMLGLAYTLAALVSLAGLNLLTDYDVEVAANLMGAGTIGFLVGLGVGLGHSLADLPAVRRLLIEALAPPRDSPRS